MPLVGAVFDALASRMACWLPWLLAGPLGVLGQDASRSQHERTAGCG